VEERLHRNNPYDLRMIRHSSAAAHPRRPAQLLGLILACAAVVQAQTPARVSRSGEAGRAMPERLGFSRERLVRLDG